MECSFGCLNQDTENIVDCLFMTDINRKWVVCWKQLFVGIISYINNRIVGVVCLLETILIT